MTQSTNLAQSLLEKARVAILDLDGTLYRGGKLLPGAVHFIQQLRERQIRPVFVSNNSSLSTSEYSDKLARMGLGGNTDEIYNALNASIDTLKAKNIKRIFALAMPKVLEELKEHGFQLVSEEAEAVLLTYDKTFDFEKFCTAYRLLQKGALFVATHPDLLCPTEDGFIPDIGCLIQAFCTAGCPEPLMTGKPSSHLIEPIFAQFGVDAQDCVVIGDRLYTDIRMANEHSIPGILVLTGESTEQDLLRSTWRPNAVIDSVAHIWPKNNQKEHMQSVGAQNN